VKQAEAESEVVVENDLYRIVFTNQGAQVKSWVLKKHLDDHDKPLELVNQIAAPKHGYPLSFWTYDPDLKKRLNQALYVSTASGELKAPADITFEFSDGDLIVSKRFGFDHSHVVQVQTSVTRSGAPVAAYPAWPAGFGDQTVAPSYAAAHVAYLPAEKPVYLTPKDVSGGNTIRQMMYWGGVTDQYFAAAFLPNGPNEVALVTLHESIQIPKNLNKPDPNTTITVPVLGAAMGNPNGPTELRMFVGPKTLDALKTVHATAPGGGQGPDLQQLVDFGWFGFIAKPLFLWLKWTHDHWIPGWGWAIVFLTVIINIALLPLKITQMKSALRMQKIAPQIKAVQEKYKKYALTDPRKQDMHKEMQALYKKHNVNPMSGCLPVLLQFPFLIAFYTMLSSAVELRHADWAWIHNLAAPDRVFVLPVLIVVSMFLLQRMTPMAGMDPMQQKMMSVMMPLMIGFISLNLAAGLTLYWVTSNVLGIVQQWVMNQTSMGREMRAGAHRSKPKTA
jgi:YidC/Oxa1 family membrane protein insertase